MPRFSLFFTLLGHPFGGACSGIQTRMIALAFCGAMASSLVNAQPLPAPLVIDPNAPAPFTQATPATPRAPVARGGFRVVNVDAPKIGDLFTQRTVTVGRGRNAQPVSYLRHAPGGPFPTKQLPIVVSVPMGMDLFAAAESMNLRRESRVAGRALLYVPVMRTQPGQDTRSRGEALVDIARDTRIRQDTARDTFQAEGDAASLSETINAVLTQEGLFEAYTVIGTEGTGTLWQDTLCLDRQRGPMPSAVFLFEGALRTTTASGCRPTRLPMLVVMQSVDSNLVPFSGGRQPPLPGQVNTGTVLSGPGSRGFWALQARCGANPSLTWIPISRGRLALETHSGCRSGGPISALTLLEGQLTESQRTTLVETFLNGSLFSGGN